MAERVKSFIFFVFIHIQLVTGQAETQPNSVEQIQPHSTFEAVVTKISDGDTIKVKVLGFKKTLSVRLLNIDTPEKNFKQQTQGEAAEVAAQRLAELIPQGSSVEIQVDRRPIDIYGRVLGYVRKSNLDINLQMVREGMAMPLFYAPNVSRIMGYREAALQAKQEKRGLFWGETTVQSPADFRFEKSGQPEAPFVGNILTGEVWPFLLHEQIPILDRIYFSNSSDITTPFYER